MTIKVTHPSCAGSSRVARGGLVLLGSAVIGAALIGLVRVADNAKSQQLNLPPTSFGDFLSDNVVLLAVPVIAGAPLALWFAAEPQC